MLPVSRSSASVSLSDKGDPKKLALRYCLGMLSRSLPDVEPISGSETALETVPHEIFVELIEEHRLAPVLFRSVKEPPHVSVPLEFADALRVRAEANNLRGLRLFGILLQMVDVLGERGIDCIPLKGPLLALRLHGDVSRRHAGDIDLLLSPDDIEEAHELLCEWGLKPIFPPSPLTRIQRRQVRRYNHHFTYALEDGSASVELHWKLLARDELMRGSFRDLFDRGQDQEVAGRRIRVLSPADEFRYLCIHGAKHEWRRLFWLYDVAKYVASDTDMEGLDPSDDLLEGPGGRAVAQALVLCRDLMGVPVPERFPAEESEARTLEYLVGSAIRAIAGSWPGPPHRRLQRLLVYETLLEGGAHSWGRSLRRAFHCPADWEIVRLPDQLFFLYRLLRLPLWVLRRFPRFRPERGP